MTALHANFAKVDRQRALWKEEEEWRLADTLSTDTLVDMLLQRDLDESQWVALMDKLGEEI